MRNEPRNSTDTKDPTRAAASAVFRGDHEAALQLVGNAFSKLESGDAASSSPALEDLELAKKAAAKKIAAIRDQTDTGDDGSPDFLAGSVDPLFSHTPRKDDTDSDPGDDDDKTPLLPRTQGQSSLPPGQDDADAAIAAAKKAAGTVQEQPSLPPDQSDAAMVDDDDVDANANASDTDLLLEPIQDGSASNKKTSFFKFKTGKDWLTFLNDIILMPIWRVFSGGFFAVELLALLKGWVSSAGAITVPLAAASAFIVSLGGTIVAVIFESAGLIKGLLSDSKTWRNKLGVVFGSGVIGVGTMVTSLVITFVPVPAAVSALPVIGWILAPIPLFIIYAGGGTVYLTSKLIWAFLERSFPQLLGWKLKEKETNVGKMLRKLEALKTKLDPNSKAAQANDKRIGDLNVKLERYAKANEWIIKNKRLANARTAYEEARKAYKNALKGRTDEAALTNTRKALKALTEASDELCLCESNAQEIFGRLNGKITAVSRWVGLLSFMVVPAMVLMYLFAVGTGPIGASALMLAFGAILLVKYYIDVKTEVLKSIKNSVVELEQEMRATSFKGAETLTLQDKLNFLNENKKVGGRWEKVKKFLEREIEKEKQDEAKAAQDATKLYEKEQARLIKMGKSPTPMDVYDSLLAKVPAQPSGWVTFGAFLVTLISCGFVKFGAFGINKPAQDRQLLVRVREICEKEQTAPIPEHARQATTEVNEADEEQPLISKCEQQAAEVNEAIAADSGEVKYSELVRYDAGARQFRFVGEEYLSDFLSKNTGVSREVELITQAFVENIPLKKHTWEVLNVRLKVLSAIQLHSTDQAELTACETEIAACEAAIAKVGGGPAAVQGASASQGQPPDLTGSSRDANFSSRGSLESSTACSALDSIIQEGSDEGRIAQNTDDLASAYQESPTKRSSVHQAAPPPPPVQREGCDADENTDTFRRRRPPTPPPALQRGDFWGSPIAIGGGQGQSAAAEHASAAPARGRALGME